MTCEACQTIPPVVVNDYQTKGEWKEVAGLKTYITGPLTSKKAIIDIYDVFGLASQTLQGADLLAAAVGAIVLVPDFLKGQVAKEEWFTTQEMSEEKAAFFKILALDENTKKLTDFLEVAKGEYSGVESWGAFGLCWGGKIAVLASQPGTSFKVSGQVHPGRLDVEDAKKLNIPHIVLASNGEDKKVVDQYHEVLVGEGKPGVVEYYGNMHHGWMGARAKLHEEENLKEYERGYNQLAAYFSKYL
jgi:dienelactone hydrolase